MNYTEVTFHLTDPAQAELLIAFLGEEGFEMFEEPEAALLKAFIPDYIYREDAVRNVIAEHFPDSGIWYEHTIILDENWNKEWEKNFSPVQIGGVYIRAPFHQSSGESAIEIVIEPKMSFGTGHHSTTSLMVQTMMKLKLKGKKVLDMGCGTSVLSILASKLGAETITAIDIDDWAVENSKENIIRNNTLNIEVTKGDAQVIKDKKFDVILANINRNIILNDISHYTASLNNGGDLLLSGFYEQDEPMIRAAAVNNGLSFVEHDVLNQWAVMRFRKQS